MAERAKSSDGRGRHGGGRWIPWAFVAFFVVVFAANGIMVYLAHDSWTGLQTEDYYEQGVAYNEVLAEARAQEELGWDVDVAFTPIDAARAEVTVAMRDGAGHALTGGSVRARFIRPTQSGFDSEVTLAPLGEGRYRANVELPLPGQWRLVVIGSHNGASYQTVRRVRFPR